VDTLTVVQREITGAWVSALHRVRWLGAAYRIRTCDPLITNQVLYRLS
jgi:hypothetical protein